MLVACLVATTAPAVFQTSISMAIATLPKSLIPRFGGPDGCNMLHWALSSLPLLLRKPKCSLSGTPTHGAIASNIVEPSLEQLLLIQPLHENLSATLESLTTTSLLPAELQLLSAALVEILLLAKSPQAVILKALLWGGGVGILISCSWVLRWAVALARIPKWRFKSSARHTSSEQKGSDLLETPMFFANLGTSILSNDNAVIDSGDDNSDTQRKSRHRTTSEFKILPGTTSQQLGGILKHGKLSEIERCLHDSSHETTSMNNKTSTSKRRNTLPITPTPSQKSIFKSSYRKKRSFSSNAQSLFLLTQAQATFRKWFYAIYVYICVGIIILGGIRLYVGKYALRMNEPLGWALGYLLGDIPKLRLFVVTSSLEQWICLPPRARLGVDQIDDLGWVEILRTSSFGAANTRLLLCAYWLCIVGGGLAVVFRLSAIYEVDTRRKVFHFMMVAMLLPATYVDPTFAALALSLMLAIFLLLDLFRASQLPPLSKPLAAFLTPYVDGRDLKGPVVISHIFLLIGCAIPLWLSLGCLPRVGEGCNSGWEVPRREVSMVSGVVCVGMGDAAASLIGRRYGRHKWIWGGGKSIEGSVAFAAAVALGLTASKLWLRIGAWPGNNLDNWAFTLGKTSVAASVASLTEAVLTGGNDNVIVPIVLWLCVKGLDI